jgi:TRAP-type C4-dicarboxylate transport system permease small subunit
MLDLLVGGVRRSAEAFCALLLGIMFVAFIVQIVFRYLLNFPIGWSSELSVITWLYLVLVGSALWLEESDQIRFNLISGALGHTGKCVVAGLMALVALVIYAMSFPAAYSYVTFMKVESTDFMKIRYDVLYSVFLLFAAATIARYAWRLWQSLRGIDLEAEVDETKVSSGL